MRRRATTGSPRTAASRTEAREDRGRDRACLAGTLLLTVLANARAVSTFFAQDDITFLSRAAGLEPAVWSFRPLSEGVAFRLEFAAFGLAPFGYHAVNLTLHLINVTAVYALARRLAGGPATAAAAALVFGLSAIAFTPLHWATGIVELLTATLVLAATLLHVEARRRGRDRWLWGAAALVLAAALSKEIAVVWIMAIAVIEWHGGAWRRSWRSLVPGCLACAGFAAAFVLTRQAARFAGSEAYARTFAPSALALNLATYLAWAVSLHEPVRDAVAAVNPRSLTTGSVVALLACGALWLERRARPRPGWCGAAWFIAFLLPVLPLAHHTYLYYLYLPWAGAALALAAGARAALARLPRPLAAAAGLLALGGFALLETRNGALRERAARDALPVDRTMRDAALLSNALPALRAAGLPAGTAVGFVNPIPRRRFDLVTGAPTREQDLGQRASYLPLEAALRGGETLRLFLPGLVDRGFATTIPREWTDVECFLFEQRGYLRRWGRGASALMRQGEFQLAAEAWEDAAASFRRARELADTLREATYGEMVALSALDRGREADALADQFLKCWPDDPRAPEIRAVRAAGH